MTHNAELVSLSVSEVGAVVVLVVLRPQAGRTFREAALRKRDLVRLIDQRASSSQERDHLTIALAVRLFVVWRANEKEGPWSTGALPTGPRATAIAEPWIVSEASHERAVEPERSLEVTDSYEDM